ncbi:hypothetical protein [Streptomyces sp. NRRL B-1347]|uniref:hypothetical protein n=1 Tax=Streptomyces sp. NRRL B-1347 TaxID=1476877 RepID=UPI00068B3AC5|nr:hypothetical protein [Streptomyces sp. NRRL B-1347]
MSHEPYRLAPSWARYSGVVRHGPAITRAGSSRMVSTATQSTGQSASAACASSYAAAEMRRTAGSQTARSATRSRTTIRQRRPSSTARCSTIGS